MKNSLTFILILFCLAAASQPPQAMNYQASLINNNGSPISNHQTAVRISIIDSIITGPILYQETFLVITDRFGLFNVEIGRGVPAAGSFNSINWGNNDKWQRTEVDTSGGSNFVLMGNSQMVSVPYALYAKEAGGKIVFDNYQGGYVINTNYQAPSDGFLIAARNHNPVSCPGLPSGFIFMDSLPVPATNFADIGMESTTTIPIKKDWYWRIELNQQCGGTVSTFKIVWIELK